MSPNPVGLSARVPAWRRRLTWFKEALRGGRGFWAWLGGFLVLLLALQLAFLVLTVSAGAIPNKAVIDALETSASQRLWDTVDFPSDGVGHATERHHFAGVSDSYTECIALTLGISAQADDGRDAFYRALAWPHLGTCSTAFAGIQSLANGEDAVNGYTYNRYWNGSAVISRPLLVLGGVGVVRVAAAAIFAAGLVLAAVTLARRASWWTPVLLLGPLLLSTNILTQALDSYPHILALGVALLGVAFGVRLGREPAPAILAYGIIAGSTFNFVDFLLNPPIAWSLFAFAVVVGRFGRSRLSAFHPLALALAAAVAGWMLGYAITWVTRWLIATVVFGKEALDEILGIIFTRLGGEYEDLVIPGLTMPTRRNVSFWLDTIPTAWLVAIVCGAVIVVALAILVVSHRRRALIVVVVAAAPALLVPIWYETLNNHSQIHMWFTYRAVPTALGILAAAAVLPLVARAGRSRLTETAEAAGPAARRAR